MDLVTYFTDPESRGWFAQAQAAAEGSVLALRGARAAGMLCCFVRGGRVHHIQQGGDVAAEDREIWTRRFGTVGLSERESRSTTTFDSRLAPAAADVVVGKHRPSAFFGTGLDRLLRQRSITDVVVAGILTSGCIRATVTDSFSYGFNTFVLRDATGDRHEDRHEANLAEIGEKYADVHAVRDMFRSVEHA